MGRGSPDESENLNLRSFGARRASFRSLFAAVLVLGALETVAALHVYADLHPAPIPPWSELATFAPGWVSLRFPSNWQVQAFDNGQFEFGGPGVLVSNLGHTFRHPGCVRQEPCSTSFWDLRGLPDTIVLIDVAEIQGPGSPRDPPALPVTIRDLDQTRLGSVYGGPQPHRDALVVGGGHLYGISVWIGDGASPEARAAAAAVVQSIRSAG